MTRKRSIRLNIERRLRFLVVTVTLVLAGIAVTYHLSIARVSDSMKQVRTVSYEQAQEDAKVYTTVKEVQTELLKVGRLAAELNLESFLELQQLRDEVSGYPDHPFVANLVDMSAVLDRSAILLAEAGKAAEANPEAEGTVSTGGNAELDLVPVENQIRSLQSQIQEFIVVQPYRLDRNPELVSTELDRLKLRLDKTLAEVEALRVELGEIRTRDPIPQDLLIERTTQLENLNTSLNQTRDEIRQVETHGVRISRDPEQRVKTFEHHMSRLEAALPAIVTVVGQLAVAWEIKSGDSRAVFEEALDEIAATTRDGGDGLILFVVFTLTGGVILFLLAPRTVALPMKRLINLISDIRDGRYTITRKLETADDIGILFRHLHNLADTEQYLETRRRELITIKEKRFSILAERVGPVMIVGSDRRILYVNNAFLSLVGCERDDLVGEVFDTSDSGAKYLSATFVAAVALSLDKRDRREDYLVGSVRPDSDDDDEAAPRRYLMNTHFIRDLRGEVVELMVIVQPKIDDGWQHVFEFQPAPVTDVDAESSRRKKT